MPRITGRREASARLNRLSGKEKVEFVGQALESAGDEIKAYAQVKISEGAVSGKYHQPSKPGEFPNYDTGHLAGNIEVERVAPLRVEVSSNARYSAALEFGTSKMAERPFMRPSTNAKRKRVIELVNSAVSIAVKRK